MANFLEEAWVKEYHTSQLNRFSKEAINAKR